MLMKRPNLLKRGYADIGGTRFVIDHLRDETFVVVLPASTHNARLEATVRVEYTSHCVSYGPRAGAMIDFAVIGFERRLFDHRGVARAFCFDRHGWSLSLPAIVKTLADRKCHFTGHGNWFVVEDIDDHGETVEYEVFFILRRDSGKSLRLVIESAYVRDAGGEATGAKKNRRGTVRFKVIVAKRLRGETVRNPAYNDTLAQKE
jgi:hypothetical protein